MNDPDPKKNIWPAVLLLGLSFLIANCMLLVFFYLTLPPVRPGPATLEVAAGSSLRRISTTLAGQGVIRDRYSFELLCKLRNLDKTLHAGTYHIPAGLNTWEVISLLTTGRGKQIKITIPEGLTNRQILRRLVDAIPSLDSLRLKKLMHDTDLLRELDLDSSIGLEGYLFPDTYFLPATVDEKSLIRLMAGRFGKVFARLTSERTSTTGLSPHKSVILASIIEKEAASARERPIISSVFHNRLRLKRPLESCATVLFVLGKHKSRLLYRDLEVKSPYNTYLHRGLPPGPICNPGRASLEAALFPDQTDYLYFVAKGDGTHFFSKSLRQHNNARNRVTRR
ncbi:MAG: endolytic transglycosylase MltG [Gemmatimonadota bacterium]|nr:endolytic transglycosylase MltG [Gemmatimonadota bacterium]